MLPGSKPLFHFYPRQWISEKRLQKTQRTITPKPRKHTAKIANIHHSDKPKNNKKPSPSAFSAQAPLLHSNHLQRPPTT